MPSSTATWPRPSESRRIRRLLYVAEGLAIGGVVSFGLVPTLQRAQGFLASLQSAFTRGTTVVALVLLVLLLRKFILVRAAIRAESIDRPPIQQDWSETRQWRWVVVAALLVVVVVTVASETVWRTRQGGMAGELSAVPFVIVGFGLYVYSWHRLGELFETRM